MNRVLHIIGFSLSVLILQAAAEATNEMRGIYERIEHYRSSKAERPNHGGTSENEIIRTWIDLIWNEGWVRKAGFDINMASLKKIPSEPNGRKKEQALSELDEFTELIHADGSVGNVRSELWTLSETVKHLAYRGNRVELKFENTALKGYALHFRFFEDGLIHAVGEEAGYFDDKALTPAGLSFIDNGEILEIRYRDEPVSVFIQRNPFAVKVLRNGELKFHQTGFNVAGLPSDPRGVRLRFQASAHDEYLGFGERFDRLKHKNTVFAQWSMGMAEALKSGSPETYKPIPFYLNPANSTGMFYNHGGIVRWDLEAAEPGVVDVSSVGGVCDYFLFSGDHPHDIYRAYTRVTGRIFGVSEWVHMPWMGHHFGGVKNANARRERLVDELVNLNKHGYTYGAMYAAGIPSGGDEIQRIHDTYMTPVNVKLGTHLDPTFKLVRGKSKSAPAPNTDLPLVMRENGSVFVSDHAFQSGNGYWDYSNPKAIDAEFNKGIDQVFMLDFGEQVAWDGILSELPGYNGREMHNLYQYLYHRAAYLNYSRRHPDGDWMSTARSAWAGSHAMGGFFAGDTTCSMDDLKSTIRAGIGLCASAGVYWGADIGAYKRQAPLTKERYLRWVQFGCFSPLMRTHAHESKEMRPWKYDDEMLASFKFHTWLRASLVPYIRECGMAATADGIPILRALPIEFPGETKAFIDDEYMFGPSLLVAPYVTEYEHARTVYLPAGTWFNFFTGRKHSGAAEFEQTSGDWMGMPVYVKAPAILPMRIGGDSPVPGRSHFKSSGTDAYANPAIDAFRIYPLAGAARAGFSNAAVSYQNKEGIISIGITSKDAMPVRVHVEVVGVSRVSRVSVAGELLSKTGSWKEMMKGPNRYFHDEEADALFVNCVRGQNKKARSEEVFHTPKQDLDGLKEETTARNELPNVLILGDSISIGYTKPVIRELGGIANVRRAKANCGDTNRGLRDLKLWLGNTKWDVIHFNWGLHDLCYRHPDSKVQGHRDKVRGAQAVSPAEYGRNLEALVGQLEKTGATLVWASTTAVPEHEAGRHVEDAAKYNAVAEAVMKRHGIAINDLHEFSGTIADQYTAPGNVHFTKDGYASLGARVADSIRSALIADTPERQQ